MSLEVFVIAKEVNIEIVKELSQIFDKITVVTPSVKGCKNTNKINFVSDGFYLEYSDFKMKLKKNLRVGWYYQQFLKYKVVQSSGCEKILIIDGDSIVSSVATRDVIFTTQKKAQDEYLNFNRILLDNSIYEEESFVTNQMLFDKVIFDSLIKKIENLTSNNWFDALIKMINSHDNAKFSEYQLYGTYAKNNYGVKVEKLRVFRRMDCVNKSVKEGLAKYDLIAYEAHHKTGSLRKIRANILFRLGVNLG
jgi:hypothetical protein